MKRVWTVALVAGAVACASVPAYASAQDAANAEREEEARALFVAGRSAFNAGRFEEAMDRFRAAYELSGRADLLYNIGQAADRLRHDEEALEAFEAYLEASPETPQRESVEARIETLRAAIARSQQAPPPPVVVAEQETRPDVVAIEPLPEVDETPRRRKRWAWGIAGAAVVVAGVVTAVLVARSGGGNEGPLPGDFGVVVTTLGRR